MIIPPEYRFNVFGNKLLYRSRKPQILNNAAWSTRKQVAECYQNPQKNLPVQANSDTITVLNPLGNAAAAGGPLRRFLLMANRLRLRS